MQNKEGEIRAVFICPDSPLPYLDEYFDYLDESDFPRIENEVLLKNNMNINKKKISDDIPEVAAEEAYKMLFKDGPEESGVNENVILIDIRRREEFEDFHAPTALHFEDGLSEKQLNNKKLYKNKKIIFVCRSGNSSKLATFKAKRSWY